MIYDVNRVQTHTSVRLNIRRGVSMRKTSDHTIGGFCEVILGEALALVAKI